MIGRMIPTRFLLPLNGANGVAPMESLVPTDTEAYAVFGRSLADHRAIVNGLLHASSRFVQKAPASDRSIDFSANEWGVSVYVHGDGRTRAMHLNQFAPYLLEYGGDKLFGLIHRAVTEDPSWATASFSFCEGEVDFLKGQAIPEIVNTKLKQKKNDGGKITFEVKVFGLGRESREFGAILRIFLDHLKKQTGESVPVELRLNGFDYSFDVINGCRESLVADVQDTIRRYGFDKIAHVDLNLFYGDLIYPDSVAVMLKFGHPDICLWRSTHVLGQGLITSQEMDAIVGGLCTNSNRPGAMIVREGTRSGEQLDIREIVS